MKLKDIDKLVVGRRRMLKKFASALLLGTTGILSSSPAAAQKRENALASPLDSISILKQHSGYETARRSLIPWNTATPDRFPEMIVRPKSEADVLRAVQYASKNGMKVGVRCSGHNTAGSALRDGGMMIDLSNLRSLTIDPDRGTACVQPGVVSIQLLQAASTQGFAFPVANCPTVAMGGYLLGGGLGFNKAHFGGVACYSLLNADIILADGRKVTVSRDEYPDLFWAVRGGGPGFFGIVTRFELQLFPRPDGIMRSTYTLSLDDLDKVIDALDRIGKEEDPRVTRSVLFMNARAAPGRDIADRDAICMVSVSVYADSDAEARQLLSPYSQSEISARSKSKSEYVPKTILELYQSGFPGRLAGDSIWANSSDALMALAEDFRRVPSQNTIVWTSYGVEPTAFRSDSSFSKMGRHYIATYMAWDNEDDDEANLNWLDQSIETTQPFTLGHYVNEADGHRYPDRIENSFSPESWNRLKQLRQQYDPNALFHSYLGHS